MNKKAIILDLDNTIYSVPDIGNELFESLFRLIADSGEHEKDMDAIKHDTMRKPFQVVAARFTFSPELTQKGVELLKTLTYGGPIEPFSDYQVVKSLPVDRFLVTTGFQKLQQSKISKMGIEHDFKAIYIVDPATSDKTKKDVFAEIMHKNEYSISEVLVIGDDPESEIKAAWDLGIDAILYDKYDLHPGYKALPRISDFHALRSFL